jgi:Spy/CpxP family protein refolding chaperone
MNGVKRMAVCGMLAGAVVFIMASGGWAQAPAGHPPMGMMGGMKGPGGPPPGGHPGGMFSPGFFQEELGLSGEQLEKFKKIRGEYQKEAIRRKAAIKIAEIELWELVEKKDATSDQLEKKVREVEGTKTDLRVYRFKQLATLKTILTPEQFEKFRGLGFMMYGPGRKMGGGMGMMGGDRDHGKGYGGGYGGYDDHGSDED